MSKQKKKICPIDAAGIKSIDYKDTTLLKQYLTKFNRIIPRYYSGVSLSNQKKLATAIKRARYMALLPYVLEINRPVSAAVGQGVSASVDAPVVLDETSVAV